MASPKTAKDIGDRLADRLAAVDSLWAAECGLPIDALPTLDPAWWDERRAVFADALAELRDVPIGRDRDVLIERAETEVAWIDSGEAMHELQAAMDGTLFRLRYVLDNLPDHPERRRAVEASLPNALNGFLETLRATRPGSVRATRRQVAATIDAISEWITAGVPASASFSAVADYLRNEYLPIAAEQDAVGAERFAAWARRYAGTSIGPDDFDWAADELLSTLGFLATRHESDDGLVLESEADHVAWAEAQLGRAAEVCAAAGILPRRDWPALVVRTFDGGGQQAYYAPRAVDGTTDATVWIAAGDGPHYVEYEKTVLFHESIPGHHVEATLQSENSSLSRYQRLMYLPGHSEGWGLYAEKLADDADLIDTPAAKAGRLGSRALRLASLLIDVGVHTGRRVPAPFSDHIGREWTTAASTSLLTSVGLEPDVAEWWLTNMTGRPAHRASYAVGERAWTQHVEHHRSLPRSHMHETALSAGPMGLDLFRSQP